MTDLAEHDCMLYRSQGGPLPWRLTGPRGPVQPNVTGSINTDDLGTIRLLALAGLGIALVPDLAAQADLAQGKLTRVLPGYAQQGAALYVVSPPLRLVPSRVTLLRDHLAARAPRPPVPPGSAARFFHEPVAGVGGVVDAVLGLQLVDEAEGPGGIGRRGGGVTIFGLHALERVQDDVLE